MAVKCNTPSLALRSVQGLLYGFSCDNVGCKLIETYLEYLNCPIDHQPCEDYTCDDTGEDVNCDISDVNLTVDSVDINTAQVSFTVPVHPYRVELKQGTTVVDTRLNPPSPIIYVGILQDTEYTCVFTLTCPRGEVKTEQVNFHTFPVCVIVDDYTGNIEEE